MFDPDKFMQQTTSEAGSTTFEPIPQGEYSATIDDIKFRSVPTKNGDSVVLDITWLLNAPEVSKQLGRDKLTVRQSAWIDTDSNGGIDMSKGKNVALNRIRDALGQNTAGKAWNPPMLRGGAAKVQVKHRASKEPGSDALFSDVVAVGKL